MKLNYIFWNDVKLKYFTCEAKILKKQKQAVKEIL